MIDIFDGFERWYNPRTFTTGIRCKTCGAVDEIKDLEIMNAARISFEHKCNVLPAPQPDNVK